MARRKSTDKSIPGGGPDFKPGLREKAESGEKSPTQELRPPYLGPDGDTSPDDMDAYLDEGNIAEASAIDRKNRKK